MQMKIVVDTPEDFKSWYRKQPKLYNQWQDANAKTVPATDVPTKEIDTTTVASPNAVAQIIK